jgi:hypothetical protein
MMQNARHNNSCYSCHYSKLHIRPQTSIIKYVPLIWEVEGFCILTFLKYEYIPNASDEKIYCSDNFRVPEFQQPPTPQPMQQNSMSACVFCYQSIDPKKLSCHHVIGRKSLQHMVFWWCKEVTLWVRQHGSKSRQEKGC